MTKAPNIRAVAFALDAARAAGVEDERRRRATPPDISGIDPAQSHMFHGGDFGVLATTRPCRVCGRPLFDAIHTRSDAGPGDGAEVGTNADASQGDQRRAGAAPESGFASVPRPNTSL